MGYDKMIYFGLGLNQTMYKGSTKNYYYTHEFEKYKNDMRKT